MQEELLFWKKNDMDQINDAIKGMQMMIVMWNEK
jgi:hypothetical protein